MHCISILSSVIIILSTIFWLPRGVGGGRHWCALHLLRRKSQCRIWSEWSRLTNRLKKDRLRIKNFLLKLQSFAARDIPLSPVSNVPQQGFWMLSLSLSMGAIWGIKKPADFYTESCGGSGSELSEALQQYHIRYIVLWWMTEYDHLFLLIYIFSARENKTHTTITRTKAVIPSMTIKILRVEAKTRGPIIDHSLLPFYGYGNYTIEDKS